MLQMKSKYRTGRELRQPGEGLASRLKLRAPIRDLTALCPDGDSVQRLPALISHLAENDAFRNDLAGTVMLEKILSCPAASEIPIIEESGLSGDDRNLTPRQFRKDE